MRTIAEDGSRRWVTPAKHAASSKPEDREKATRSSRQRGHTVLRPRPSYLSAQTGPTVLLITRLNPDDLPERTHSDHQASLTKRVSWSIVWLFHPT